MNRWPTLLALSVFLHGPGREGTALASSRSVDTALLDVLLGELREQTGVPGLAAAVARNGELLWQGEAGNADVTSSRAVSSETVFRLASVSKAVCSVIAAKLLEDDVLGIDARVGDWLPEAPRQYHELTFRDLMTHTSGLPHYEPRDAGRGRKHYASAVAALEQIGDRDLVSAPGTSYVYSTHGFSFASAMMERASGKTFPELFEDVILRAAALDGLALESEHPQKSTRALLYEGSKDSPPRELEPENFSYSWCGAGMESTARALSSFASTLFGEESLLGREGRSLLREPLTDRDGDVVSTDRWDMTLGWRRSTDVRGELVLHHAGVTNGARSIVAVWPESGLAVTLLSNASWTGRMEDTAVAFALGATAPEIRRSCEPAARQAYEGLFRDVPIRGAIRWRSSPSCRGTLSGDNELTAWLSGFNFAEPHAHVLIPFSGDHWGLVTPIGISVLTGDTKTFSGNVGSRPLRIEPAR